MDKPATPLPRILREGPITPELCDRAAEHIEVQNANLATLTAINAELVEALEKIAGVRTVKFDGSEPTENVEIARTALARAKENSNGH